MPNHVHTVPESLSTSVVEYALDAGERRIAKRVGNEELAECLWTGMTRLLAVYDESDNLVARFEYADGPLPARMVQGRKRSRIAEGGAFETQVAMAGFCR